MTHTISDARERVLTTAETLFHQNGFNAVSMRDLANALGIKQASLYYHVPDGKEQLFVEVTERGLQRHHQGITAAIATANSDIESQLTAVAHWFIAQPPLNLMPMFESDMPAIAADHAQHLNRVAYNTLFAPITAIFAAAISRDEINDHQSADHLAGIFLLMVDGVMYAHRTRRTDTSMDDMATNMINMILNGLRPRQSQLARKGEPTQ